RPVLRPDLDQPQHLVDLFLVRVGDHQRPVHSLHFQSENAVAGQFDEIVRRFTPQAPQTELGVAHAIAVRMERGVLRNAVVDSFFRPGGYRRSTQVEADWILAVPWRISLNSSISVSPHSPPAARSRRAE